MPLAALHSLRPRDTLRMFIAEQPRLPSQPGLWPSGLAQAPDQAQAKVQNQPWLKLQTAQLSQQLTDKSCQVRCPS